MKKRYLIYILNSFLGLAFAAIFLILKKKGILNQNQTQNISVLILFIFLLYAIVLFVLKSKRKEYSKPPDFLVYIPFLVLFLVPVGLANFFFKDYFNEEIKEELIESKFEFISDNKVCNTIKYGTFLVDQDTITRF